MPQIDGLAFQRYMIDANIALGRRSEAASHPYKATTPTPRISVPTAKPLEYAPLALIGKVGRQEEVVAACEGARGLGVHPGMAATHARALVSDLDFRPAEPGGGCDRPSCLIPAFDGAGLM